MNTLINTLRTETETLKNQYFEMTKKWATNYFNSIMRKKEWKEITWCEHFGLEPRIANPGTNMEFYTFPNGFYNTKLARQYDKIRNEIRSLSNMGLEAFIAKEMKKAELHYESSLLKLAYKIELKKIDIHNMSVVTGHVGVNIDMTLTDGEKTVKAFTIIAEGQIQRPHYRYLVK
jgi:hypothetical protein